VPQFTFPLTTLITTGTSAPVRVVPQDEPAEPADGRDDVHAARPTATRPAIAAGPAMAAATRYAFNCRIVPDAVPSACAAASIP
jgi:hypothetical protein